MTKRDRIYKLEFDKIVKKTMDITSKERAYLDEVFGSRLVGGLTIEGLKYKMDELYYSKEKIVSQHKLGIVKANIIAALTEENKPVLEKSVTKK